jgi:hypothetical protein
MTATLIFFFNYSVNVSWVPGLAMPKKGPLDFDRKAKSTGWASNPHQSIIPGRAAYSPDELHAKGFLLSIMRAVWNIGAPGRN